MLDGRYKSYLSLIALDVLTVPVAVPDVELCIGDCERMESIPVLVSKQVKTAQPKAIRGDVKKQPYETTGAKFNYEPLENSDFNTEFYLGSSVERWGL